MRMGRHGWPAAGLMLRCVTRSIGNRLSLHLQSREILASLLIGCFALGLVPAGGFSTAPAQTLAVGRGNLHAPQTATAKSAEATANTKGAEALSRRDDQDSSRSEMRPLIERYIVDRTALFRAYPGSISPARHDRLRRLYSDWFESLKKLNFDAMELDGRVDYVLFRNHLEYEIRQLDIQASQSAEIEPLVPFQKTITDLDDSRRRMQPIKSSEIAAVLSRMKLQIEDTQRKIEAGSRRGGADAGGENGPGPTRIKKAVANRAVAAVNNLRNTLRAWFNFYSGYDPLFTWWVDEPYKGTDQALAAYGTFLTERLVGVRGESAPAATADARPAGPRGTAPGQGGGRPAPERTRTTVARPGDSSDIIGDPIGREALMVELANEMIPYTPEELIALAKKEMAWCEAEMVKASRDLGYGEDWHKALEYVKTLYVEPGKQPDLIRDLALEAIKFIDDHDLVTVPQLARETWRMEMMSPERQLVSPFFLGGETILVSFPTNTMTHEQKMMSMRGNNIHFARATVFHELIPGHHLQGYMSARYKPYRGLFNTPFWGEGWALYWELLLWDMNFAKTPENRIGMLFWRMHRAARIIFSLSFHLEQMTPKECIDFLVQRVGHEVDNATAEVRRSFAGNYSPLYQAAYLLGGLQLRALHKELVESGKMTNRAFHDAVLKENEIPIEMVRVILTRQTLTRDFKSSWKF